MDNAREYLPAQRPRAGPYAIRKWFFRQEQGHYPRRMHDGGLRDAKCFVTNGPEPCWHGRKEDPESKDVGIAVSCMLQVRP